MGRRLEPPMPGKRQARLSYFRLSAKQSLPPCKSCGQPTANLKSLICQPCKEL